MPSVEADRIPCGVVELDADGRVDRANAVFLGWVGLVDTESRMLAEFFDSADPAEAFAAREILFLTSSSGPSRPVLLELSVDRRIAVILDATRRQEVEDGFLQTHALVRRTQNRLQLVIDASIAFAAAATESELAGLLAVTAARAYAAEETIVFLNDDSAGLQHAAGTYPFPDLAYAELTGLAALRRGEVVKISGAEAAFEVAAPIGRAFASAGVHSMIIAPIHHEGALLGIAACFFLHPRQFDDQASPLAEALAGQAGQVITTLRLQQRLEHAATHDETTGLPNRRFLEETFQRPRRDPSSRLAIFFIDLDGFKLINDTLGHVMGDELLRDVGRRLVAVMREDDIVARYGGDEFVVAAEVSDTESAAEIAERLRLSLEDPYEGLPLWTAVTASIGVAVSEEGSTVTADRLIRLADRTMYTAKSDGGNRATVVLAG